MDKCTADSPVIGQRVIAKVSIGEIKKGDDLGIVSKKYLGCFWYVDVCGTEHSIPFPDIYEFRWA